MPATRYFVFALIALALFGACGGPGAATAPASQAPADQSTAQPAQATPGLQTPAPAEAADPTEAPQAQAPGTSLTGCELITASDVETVLELDPGTVSAGELREKGTVLDPAVNECKYDGQDWGGLSVLVTPTDGVNTFNAVDKTFGENAETLQVGDAALWFEDNDRGYFLKGSVLVLLQFNYLVESDGSFRDATVALGEAAVARI